MIARMIRVLLLFVSIIQESKSDDLVIRVSQNGVDTPSCLTGTGTVSCKSLAYIAEYCGSNVVVSIESSYLSLEAEAEFINLSNITIQSRMKSEVICTCDHLEEAAACGVSFYNSSLIRLVNFIIRNCSYQFQLFPDLAHIKAGVLFYNVEDIKVANVSIFNSTGSGMVLYNSQNSVELLDSNFTGNSDKNGGTGVVVIVAECRVCTSGFIFPADYRIRNCKFSFNVCYQMHFSTNELEPGLSGGGLGIFLLYGAQGNTFRMDDSAFVNNVAVYGGGFSFYCHDNCYNNVLEINNCHFAENSLVKMGPLGGAGAAIGITRSRHHHPFNNTIYVGSSTFVMNHGFYGAGLVLYASINDTDGVVNKVSFDNCTWLNNGGPSSPAVEVTPNFFGISGSLFLIEPLFQNCKFLENFIYPEYLQKPSFRFSYHQESGIFIVTKMKVFFKGETTFERNNGTAMYVSEGKIIFTEGTKSLFKGNSGERGGAIALIGFSYLIFHNNSVMHFVENRAMHTGGAIFVSSIEQHLSYTSRMCFMQYVTIDHQVDDINAMFIFDGNAAESGFGHSMFITSVDPCRYSCSSHNGSILNPASVFGDESCIANFSFSNQPNPFNIVTEGRVFNITTAATTIKMTPGSEYILPLQVIDDFNHDVSNISVYQSHTSSNSPIVIDSVFNFISEKKIRVYGNPYARGNVTLTVVGVRGTAVDLPVVLSPCPPGFVSITIDDLTRCICSSTLGASHSYNGIDSCSSENAFINLGFWVGYILTNGDLPDENNLYTADCPAGFCNQSISANQTPRSRQIFPLGLNASKKELEKMVCVASREGILCSECKEGYSVYFHSTSHKCDVNDLCHYGIFFYILSEIIPITVLFIIILWFNINLTSGIAYSVLFMVQLLPVMIITVNGALEFLPKGMDLVHSVVYGTLNLNFLEIDMFSYCLWSGAGTLDMIAIKYVSFVYAILLTFLYIIVVSKCPYRLPIARYFKRRKSSTVHGLTAFFVICYFQCSRTTFLLMNKQNPEGVGRKSFGHVVFWNGTIRYFSVDHLPYVIPALFFLVVFMIPLPFILIFDQSFVRFESYAAKCSTFVNKKQPWTWFRSKMKPIFDSFQGCFKGSLRFYAGMFFLNRIIILILIDSTTSPNQYFVGLEVFLLILVTMQSILQPFVKRTHNIIAALVLTDMAIINALTMRIYNIVSSRGYITEARLLQWLQLILIYIPFFYGCVCVVLKVCSRHLKPKKYQKFEELDNESDFPEDMFDRSGTYLYGAVSINYK